jgi:hypothetical protein
MSPLTRSISGEKVPPSMLYVFVFTQFRTQNRFTPFPELLYKCPSSGSKKSTKNEQKSCTTGE